MPTAMRKHESIANRYGVWQHVQAFSGNFVNLMFDVAVEINAEKEHYQDEWSHDTRSWLSLAKHVVQASVFPLLDCSTN